MRMIAIIPALLIGCATAASVPPAAAPKSAPAPKAPPLKTGADGFGILFDGVSAEGWKMAGPGSFEIKDGAATTVGGMGLWYYEPRKFKNYILRLEFRQKLISSNSGVFIRFPRVEDDPWIPVEEGYEVQIAGDKPGTHATGSVYSFQAATAVPIKAAGEWNDYEISVLGPWIYVTLNGRPINAYKGDRSLKGGMVGIQNHDNDGSGKSAVSYRNIRVFELPESATGIIPIIDLKGWKTAEEPEFVANDGVLVSKGGPSFIWTEAKYKNFILLLEWKVGRKNDNSGVFLRLPAPGDDPGTAAQTAYEVQICDTGVPKERTGSIFGVSDARSMPTREVGQWNALQVSVTGNQYKVWVNGQLVNDFTGDRVAEGHIGLQAHSDESVVSYRNLRLVTLK